jgi:hypothetical protein
MSFGSRAAVVAHVQEADDRSTVTRYQKNGFPWGPRFCL